MDVCPVDVFVMGILPKNRRAGLRHTGAAACV